MKLRLDTAFGWLLREANSTEEKNKASQRERLFGRPHVATLSPNDVGTLDEQQPKTAHWRVV